MAKKFSDIKEILKIFSKPDGIPGLIAYTRDHYYVEEIYKAYLKHLKKRFKDIEEIHINGREDVLESFHAEFSIIPMFNETRYIWVRHSDMLFDKIKDNKKVLSLFLRDLENLSDNVFLYLHFDEKKISKEFKFLEEKFSIFEPIAMKERDAVSYIIMKTETAQFRIDSHTAKVLAELCGSNHKFITEALNRLFLYKIVEKEIKEEDVILAALDIEGNYYFAILDYLSEKKTQKAIQKILSQNRKDMTIIFSGIMKLFTDAYRYTMLKKINISNKMNMIEESSSAWMMRKSEERIQKVLQNYSFFQIEKIIHSFPELDQKRKSNAGLESHALIHFIYSLNL